MDHAFYVYSSYAFAAILTLGAIGWTWLDGRLRQKEIAALEASGIRRRSQRRPDGEAKG
jgi:heme exporter protein D